LAEFTIKMVIYHTKVETFSGIQNLKGKGKKVGFVPTMGALHAGHLSLIERAKAENDVSVMSIFVNPTQFNNSQDLQNYPRTFEMDVQKLQNSNTDILFYPTVEEMYPTGQKENDTYDFGMLEKIMEGKFRPGHFKGVAQVVSKLFKIVQPDSAYFGEKDFQQLAIIRELVKKMNSPIQIVACPTKREPDGLALSSRNSLLSPEQKKEAVKISEALLYIKKHQKKLTVEAIKAKAIELIEQSGKMKVEYLEIADEQTLLPIENWNQTNPIRTFAAVKTGNVRLIDNLAL
jgi:pantoate--beta-alanine ligase